MAWRFYLMPKAGSGADGDGFRPAYVTGLAQWAALDYGNEPVFLVAADVTPAQHTTIAGSADVAAFPSDLSVQVGVNLATVQASLETRNFPGAWVEDTHTYRQLLRGVGTLCQIAQRYQGLSTSRIFSAGIT